MCTAPAGERTGHSSTRYFFEYQIELLHSSIEKFDFQDVRELSLHCIFMEKCMKEMKCKVVSTGAKLRLNGEIWPVVTCLFVDDTVLLAESEGDLQRIVNEFFSVCKRRKLKVNAGNSKVMVFERREEEVINFNTAYTVRLPAVRVVG